MSVFNVFFFILSSQCPIRTQVFKIRIQCTTSIKNDKNVLHLFLFIRHPTGRPDVVYRGPFWARYVWDSLHIGARYQSQVRE